MRGIGFYSKDFFTIKYDEDLISESIKRILMTNPGERVGQPMFGVGLKNNLFDPGDEAEIGQIRENLMRQIMTYEPRVNILDVQMSFEEHTLTVGIRFYLKSETPQDERFISVTIAGSEE